jgi:hypothetical protein
MGGDEYSSVPEFQVTPRCTQKVIVIFNGTMSFKSNWDSKRHVNATSMIQPTVQKCTPESPAPSYVSKYFNKTSYSVPQSPVHFVELLVVGH